MSEQTNSSNSTPTVSKRTAQFGVIIIATLLIGCLAVLIAA